MVRNLALLIATLLIVIASGCTSPSAQESANRPEAQASEAQVPSAPAIPEDDYLPARRAAALQLPAGISAGDLQVIDDRPEAPEAWWQDHESPPYKMIHLRLEDGGASPGRYDCWPAQASEDATWSCEIIEPEPS